MADAIVVGKSRPTNNPIINALKCEVGKVRKHANIPITDINHTFGAPCKRDEESAGDVMLSWDEHLPPSKPADLGRDFIRLNKSAAKAGCATPSQVKYYRTAHDARIRPQVSLQKDRAPLDDPTRAYGRKSGVDSTSVRDLMQNKYEMEWVHEQLQRESKEHVKEQKRIALREQSPLRVRATPSPSAVYFASRSPSPQLHDSFTLKQFKNVPSKLQGYIPRSYSPTAADHAAARNNRSNTPSLPPVYPN